MNLTNKDKKAIKELSKVSNMANSEMRICKPDGVSEISSNRKLGLMQMDCMGDFNLAQACAREMGARRIYRASGKEITLLFPKLTATDIRENNLFVAGEVRDDMREIVIVWTGE